MTGFEPATTRTPCVYATRLRHIPKSANADKIQKNNTQLLMPPAAEQPGYHTEFILSMAEGPHPEIGLQKYKF